jgi:hypothetical protein
VPVPEPSASIHELLRFGLTYSAYDRGKFGDVAAAANGVSQEWRSHGRLPDDIGLLRVTLFFLQRCAHWDAGSNDESLVRAVVAQLGALSGGEVVLEHPVL